MHFKMSIFKKHRTLDFSDENIKSLSESIVNLKSILSKVGTSIGSQQLNNVLASAMRKDSESFKKNTLTNALFGGAGALWELYCGDDDLQNEFDKEFKKFCLELKKIGINNGRVNQVLDGLK
tara:strand:+ start:1529 stop:1894 length:366 start_codon:yes stop_codon:yes gene_type:complete